MAACRGGWEAPPLPRDYSWYVSNIGEPWASAAIVDRVQGLAAAGALRSGSADSLQTRLARGAYALRKTARNVLRRGDHRYLDHKFARLSLPEVEDLLRAFDASDVEASAYSGDFIHIRQRREG